ncbi:MAG: 50S ribosomal protein L31e [Thermoprotei archaeon]|nr:MAG: 50S ribosomal protein L31e [Thermoprotei archaeon]HDI31491.1 50S ribosomal protein L31e [Thermofilum sp.]
MSEKESNAEKVYVIPLRDVYRVPRKKRAKVAIRIIHEFVQRHLKVKYVVIGNDVNEYIWHRSIEKPPRRVKVSVSKVEEDLAEVSLYQE